jgi:hypothetical protein
MVLAVFLLYSREPVARGVHIGSRQAYLTDVSGLCEEAEVKLRDSEAKEHLPCSQVHLSLVLGSPHTPVLYFP